MIDVQMYFYQTGVVLIKCQIKGRTKKPVNWSHTINHSRQIVMFARIICTLVFSLFKCKITILFKVLEALPD